jgi:metallophosphoesterase superfamily enzyme
MSSLVDVEIRPGWRLSAERSLFLARESTLVVADIHWGYADSHRHAGNLLPLWGNEQLKRRLEFLLAHYRPNRMIWLGDSLHTRGGAKLAEDFLDGISPEVEVIVLAGNHDRSWSRADLSEYRLGECIFHHGDQPRKVEAGHIEIIGHIHPAFAWSDGAGLRLKVPALVEGPNRIILPCFSEWSSGATWNENLGEGDKLWLISARKIWDVTSRRAGRS